MRSLPKNLLGLDQLLRELAPDLKVGTYRTRHTPPISGRAVQDDAGSHVLHLWPVDGRWLCREIIEARGRTHYCPVRQLQDRADLARLLGLMLLLEPRGHVDMEAHLRERARLLGAEADHADEAERQVAVKAADDELQRAYEVVLPLVDLSAFTPRGPFPGRWQLGRMEDVGEVAEWGPPLRDQADLVVATRSAPHVEAGWYVVLVGSDGEVAEWGPQICGPTSLRQLLGGLREGDDA